MAAIYIARYTGRLIDGEKFIGLAGLDDGVNDVDEFLFRGRQCFGTKLEDGKWYIIGNSLDDEVALGGPVGPYSYEGLCALIRLTT